MIDPFRQEAYAGVGWEVVRSAGLEPIATLMAVPSSVALPALVPDGTHQRVGDDPAAESVPRCRAMRLPDPSFEPPFDGFRPF